MLSSLFRRIVPVYLEMCLFTQRLTHIISLLQFYHPFIHPSIPANKSKEKAYGVVIGNDGYLPAKLRVRAGHK